MGRCHPNEKPESLMKYLLKKSPAEIIFDPFMGSGTTGVAAVKMGRKFIGIEIEPAYFDIAIKRISDALKQPDLFIEKRARAIQESFDYQPRDDFAKGIDAAYEAIKDRVAAGGKGWEPK
jgi:DNA modification methylase